MGKINWGSFIAGVIAAMLLSYFMKGRKKVA